MGNGFWFTTTKHTSRLLNLNDTPLHQIVYSRKSITKESPHKQRDLRRNMFLLDVVILQHHLPNKARLKAPTRLTPKPPSSLGVQIDSQFIQAIFLKSSPSPQLFFKKIDSIEEIIPAGALKKERK